jgi:hypothetical protein
MADKISWSAPEFNYTPKGPDWYWMVGLTTLALVVTALVSGNILFAIILVIGSISIAIQSSQKPEVINIKATDQGVQVADTLYPFSSLRSFWVVNTPHEKKLLLRSEKTYMPYVVIPIEEVNPENVRHFLLQYLPEEKLKEPLIRKIMEYLGF